MSQHPFQPLNDFFDAIYVLTLDRAVERHKHIRNVLNGLDFQFFSGIDGSQKKKRDYVDQGVFDQAKHREHKRGRTRMSVSEISCALSHRAILEDIAKNHARALILEDDIIPAPQALGEFKTVAAELPDDWEFFMLGYSGERFATPKYQSKLWWYQTYHRLGLFGWGKRSLKWIRNQPVKDYSPHLWRMGRTTGGHAYAVTGETARKFVEYQTPIFMQADRIFYDYAMAHGLNAYMAKKPFFVLSELSSESYIGYRTVPPLHERDKEAIKVIDQSN